MYTYKQIISQQESTNQQTNKIQNLNLKYKLMEKYKTNQFEMKGLYFTNMRIIT